MGRKKSLFTIVFLLFSSCVFSFAAENIQSEKAPDWEVLETGNVSIYYKSGADFYRIERSLRERASYFSSDMPSEDAMAEDKVRYQIAALFRRAEEILDMQPPNMRLHIKIFPTRNELNDEYARIFESREGEYKSFYVHKYNTIYTSEEDISDSVISHEMGHAIVDHYFAVIPPEKVRELLASYVDLHLAD